MSILGLPRPLLEYWYNGQKRALPRTPPPPPPPPSPLFLVKSCIRGVSLKRRVSESVKRHLHHMVAKKSQKVNTIVKGPVTL